jgi:hypothetical protein
MIGWILRHLRELDCDHKWAGPHGTKAYGRLTRRLVAEDTERQTGARKVYICSKCQAKRVLEL